MVKKLGFLIILILPQFIRGQEKALELLIADSSMIHSSISLCILNTGNGESVFEYCPDRSLTPASVLKLITSSAALELLGPDYVFKTVIGYTGNLNKKNGRLTGDIVIKGGGDPALGSSNFGGYYVDFLKNWTNEIISRGIKKIDGKIITDDSYYDYQPVPSKWLWEDEGNYYGAGAYGLSVFDNLYEIHFRSNSENSNPVITRILPAECKMDLANRLISAGNSDEGYVFASPYVNRGWIEGTIPADREDFVLKAAITDPPLLLSFILNKMLDSAGIIIKSPPSTIRIDKNFKEKDFTVIAETDSPPLKELIGVLNHESVNLYAEHLAKELGKVFKNKGATSEGIEIIRSFLNDSVGINSSGIFIEDGSGLSPIDAIDARSLANLLVYMKNKSRYFSEFYTSLPEPGKEGTLKNHFKDPVFESNLRAKSGSMTRVRSYAGYFKTLAGKDLAFTIIINNFAGPSQKIITGIEGILKETILYK